jgi:hypothetical protein
LAQPASIARLSRGARGPSFNPLTRGTKCRYDCGQSF